MTMKETLQVWRGGREIEGKRKKKRMREKSDKGKRGDFLLIGL